MHRRLLGALALMLGAAPVAAQGWIEVERPRLPQSNPGNVTRVASQVRVTLDGRIARVEVEERFRNTGGGLAEGSYLYPLPGEAVFQNFSLWMGEQEIKGEMLNANDARSIYEEIVRRQKDPALLTLAGHGLVRAQVFPIPPGETRRVVLRYTQLLDRAGDALRFRYALGSRGPKEGEVRVTLPEGAGFGAPYSPTHTLATRTVSGHSEVAVDATTGGDLELFLPLRRGLVGTTVLTHAPGGEDGYAMLLLAPSQQADGAVIPRDLTLVVDVSGSMSGDKLTQAKAALVQAIGTLRNDDRFRLIAFSNGVRNFRDGYALATGGNLAAARQFIADLEADGGTNIAGALDAALGTAVAEDRLPLVLFLTDGIPSVGEQEPDRIAAAAAGRIGRTRVFTIGVGHDVNTYLLDRLAREGRGAVEYVAPEANVEVAVGSVMAKLRLPALVNLRIVESPVTFRQQTPVALPDLFYGEELVLFARYQGQGRGAVVIEGERNGHRERFTAEAVFPAVENDNDFIPRLWASRRIGELTRQIRLEGSSDALIREIRDLGLRHGILTEYTSYLVQEPGMAMGGTGPLEDRVGRRAQQPVPASAPAAQTGAVAFERARESGRMSSAQNLAEADAVADQKAMRLFGTDAEVRRAGGRLFRLMDGVWTDLGHRDTVRVVTIAPFSSAYFSLTRALPELAAPLSVGESTLVAGGRVSIKVATGGRQSLKDDELRQMITDFRSTP